MNSFLLNHHRKLFYAFWLFLGILQAASTKLIDDEAYYWVYSRFLSWGYFDHPPMTALLIKAGYGIFQNELGVRLLSVLLNVLTIFILEALTERKNYFLFYAIALGIVSFQVLGFLAVPDNALLFFTALFFYAYRKFLHLSTITNTLFIGLVTALLLYTKYHGVLVVFFTLISNMRLLAKWQTWLAGFLALLLYIPHLHWHWQNEWIGIRYQLFENNFYPFRISNTIEYLLGQLLLAGPIAGFLLLPAAFVYSTQNKMERALKFTMVGIYAFFFISTFRGSVEVNWPVPVLIPLAILSHHYLSDKMRFFRLLRVITGISLVLTVAARIYMVIDLGPDNTLKYRFHASSRWVPELNEKTGKYPVIFANSYQRASQFWFYTGKPSHEIHHYTSRRTNYNLWPTDLDLLGKPVFIVTQYKSLPYKDSVYSGNEWLALSYDSLFSPMGKISIHPEKNSYAVKKGESFSIKVHAVLPDPYPDFLRAHPELATQVIIGITENKRIIKEIEPGISVHKLLARDTVMLVADTKDLPRGKYTMRFTIRVKNYMLAHNSNKIRLIIE